MVKMKGMHPKGETNTIRVIIADDQIATRRALKALFIFEPRIEIIGEACNGAEAIRLVGEMQPDLVLMDVEMPVMDGLKATQKIKADWPDVKVVVFTIYSTYREEAYRVGADYFMIKGSSDLSPSQRILSFFPL